MAKGIKLVLWSITLLLAYYYSCLIEIINVAEAFFLLHAGVSGLLLIMILIICAFGKYDALNRYRKVLICVLRFVVALVITSIMCFLAMKIVNVNFYVAYLIMTFGQSMYNVEYVEEENLKGFRKVFSSFKPSFKLPKIKLAKKGKKKKNFNYDEDISGFDPSDEADVTEDAGYHEYPDDIDGYESEDDEDGEDITGIFEPESAEGTGGDEPESAEDTINGGELKSVDDTINGGEPESVDDTTDGGEPESAEDVTDDGDKN